ncbi:uncharacterized protein LOC105686790 [Athalia rosae]|uniref:uncharacterized protein LOC105686790 n=1 Tax=Athalia rosae TaxID=37344 RepID=UPI0020338D65|nr:uncharacterized protein LOC105686790 [Athalia rosae]
MAQRISLTNVLPLIAVVTVVLGKFGATSNRDVSFQRVRAVRLNGGHMEIIEEETCSRGVTRLTCRSLRASLLVLEATYQTNHSDLCRHRTSETNYGRKNTANFHAKMVRHLGLRGNYMDDYRGHSKTELADLRLTLNRRCSGLQHCRFNVHTDHPEAVSWTPANLRLKYACIPDAAIGRYCNSRLLATGGDGSYLKSPGYPLYYPGGSSCGWTFESPPGQRISLTLYDLNLRSAEQDGSCVDIIRIRENGVTLLESCGTAAGIQVVSESNVITLDLIALGNLYPSRGFLLQYKAVGCPRVDPPNGSYVVNDTGEVMTFRCRVGTLFPDTRQRTKIIRCKDGLWMNTAKDKGGRERSCVPDSSAAILKAERENGRFTSLSEEPGSAGFFPPGGVVERSDDAVAMNLGTTMDPGRSAMVKQGDYVVDVVLPTVLIALLFIGNAIIVYVIFQFRKRKQPELSGEEMALRGNDPQGLPQV